MPDKLPRKKEFRKVALLSSLGLMIPSSIAIGLFFGYFLDKIFHTRPWMLLIFMLLGTASGFLGFIRGMNKYKDVENEEE